ncbi:MAG: putative Ig domain-containing protein, partial [Bryobacteraceae bacterium]
LVTAQTTLPPGIALTGAGLLSGTPTTTGNYTFTVRVNDASGQTATRSLQITIIQGSPALTLTTPSPLPPAGVGATYNATVRATGGTPPYRFSLAGGAMPPGLLLNPDGTIIGAATEPGTFTPNIQVTDVQNRTAVRQYTIVASPAPVITNTSPLPGASAGTGYNVTFNATNGTAPYRWSVNALPAGLTLDANSGVLGGTPAQQGSYTFNITATDTIGVAATKAFTLVVGPPGPGVQLSSDSLTFTGVAGGHFPPPQFFSIVSASDAAAGFTLQPDNVRWLALRPARAAITPARIGVFIDTTGMGAGSFQSRIVILQAEGRQQTVNVTLNLIARDPQLEAAPELLRFAGTAQALASSEQVLLLRNAGGGGSIAYNATVKSGAPWLRISPAAGQTSVNARSVIRATVDARTLAPGPYRGEIEISSSAGVRTAAVSLLVRTTGQAIGLSVDGLRFDARAGGGVAITKNINVLALGNLAVNWRAEIVSGSEFLSLNTLSGQATSQTPGVVTLSVNAASLAAGDYSALVRFTDPGAVNSPVYLVVGLNVAAQSATAAPDPSPSGMLFVAVEGGAAPAPQQLRVFASRATPVAFQASAITTDGANWLSVTPTTGVTSTATLGTASVSVNLTGLRRGTYTGDVTTSISTVAIRTTNVTLIVLPAGATLAEAESKGRAAAGCPPTRLVPTHTGLVNSFATPAGYPQVLAVRVADDCGDPVPNSQVTLNFSNGDPAIPIPRPSNLAQAVYTATWTPKRTDVQVTVTATATHATLTLGTAELTGAVTPAQTPILGRNATLNNLHPQAGAPLAPGTVVQLFGTDLAPSIGGPSTVPLPTTFNGTRIIVGGAEAPLFYLSPGQLNAQLPNELEAGKEYSILVAAGNGFSQPDTIVTAAAQPGVAAFSNGVLIAQHSADFTLITDDSPARAGEVITIYLVGMGATNPPVASAQPAPSPPATARTQPVVTIGDRTAELFFAGLNPGGVGLYQINLRIPAGLAAGDYDVVVKQGDAQSNTTTLTVR